jgi:CRP-like cAMP-binding protein
MSNDILQLRTVATCSIALSLVVLTFMHKVPKTPFLWNSFYLIINLAWCTLLYYERYEADRMSDEFERIYHEGRFEQAGFSRVEFRRVFLRGTRKEFPAGHKLKAAGRSDPELIYLSKGGVRISQEGEVLRQYKGRVFVGEVSFLPYLTGETIKVPPSPADVVVLPGGVVAYVWNYRMLRDFLQSDRQTRNAVLAFISHDLREKLMMTSNQELALLQGRPVAAGLARRGGAHGSREVD